MDREPEELQFMGLAGVLAASCRLIAGRPQCRLFAHITAYLILPLSLLFLAHNQISYFFVSEIVRDMSLALNQPQVRHIMLLIADCSRFLLFWMISLFLLRIYILFSSSTVAYTVASIFTAKDDLSFPKVFAVVPAVWARRGSSALNTAYMAMLFSALPLILSTVFCFGLLLPVTGAVGYGIFILFLMAYVAGLIWEGLISEVACVILFVAGLIPDHEVIRQARPLVRGKALLTCGIFLLLALSFVAIDFAFWKLVVEGSMLGIGGRVRIGYGVVMWVLLTAVILLGLVAQTVVYCICKTHHRESVDKWRSADRLEVHLCNNVPLIGEDIELGEWIWILSTDLKAAEGYAVKSESSIN